MSKISKDLSSGLDFIACGETEKPKRIMVVLHGTGGNCVTMERIGQAFARSLPDTLVLVPSGSVPLSALFPPDQIEAAKKMDPSFDPEAMRNWVGSSTIQPVDDDSFLRMLDDVFSAPVYSLNTFIDAQLEKHGLDDRALAIYGFSAGGLMALHTVMDRENECAAVVSHSGHFLGGIGALAHQNVLMMVGDQELAHPMSPMRELFPASVEGLRAVGHSVTEHVCKNLAHDINQEAFDTVCDFVTKGWGTLPEKTPSAPKSSPKP